MIENAYSYMLDKKSVPIKKLALNVRAGFSTIYDFLRSQPQKNILVFDSEQRKAQSNIVGRGTLRADKKQKYVDPLEQLSPAVVKVLKMKVYLLYGQAYSRVGLLSNYRPAIHDKPTLLEYDNPSQYVVPKTSEGDALSKRALEYAGCQWKINVVLSTNTLDKVMRPEVILEIQTRQGE